MYWINIDMQDFLTLIGLNGSRKLQSLDDLEFEEQRDSVLPLFVKDCKQNESNSIVLNVQLLNTIAQKTGLLHLKEQSEGNICYSTANSDLRDEFKISFTTLDLFYYSYGRQQAKYVDYPESAVDFWHYVQVGKTLLV